MALFELNLVVIFLVAAALITVGALFLWGIKHAIAVAVNSILGFFALYAVQSWLLNQLIINVWSVLFVGFLGIFGLILVVILHLVGVWF